MDEEPNNAPLDSHRFFKASAEVYEGMRAHMDGEFGHPKPGTLTCLPPLNQTRKDGNGFVLASVSNAEAALAGDLLEDLLDAAIVEEVFRQDWEALAEGSL